MTVRGEVAGATLEVASPEETTASIVAEIRRADEEEQALLQRVAKERAEIGVLTLRVGAARRQTAPLPRPGDLDDDVVPEVADPVRVALERALAERVRAYEALLRDVHRLRPEIRRRREGALREREAHR
jgi:hypothetical protein